ncbi:MAG: hypothetical protein QW343_04110 [Candidatus Norongarragalinales archaeon]
MTVKPFCLSQPPLTALDEVTRALRASSENLHRAAGSNYAALFRDSTARTKILNNHQPERLFDGKLAVVKVVLNRITGREQTEWSKRLGISKVTCFPQHVVAGDDLVNLLRVNAPFGNLTHTLLPAGRGRVKEVFSIEVRAPRKKMNEFLALFKQNHASPKNSLVRGVGRDSWVFVTPDEALLKNFVTAYAKKFGRRLHS